MSLIEVIVPLMPSMAVTAPLVAPWIPAIWTAISSVALAVWLAKLFTSLATTAKPLPASPARAASMVALSASRLVCPAMLVMSWTTAPIRCAASASPRTVSLVRLASVTACPAMPVERVTKVPISRMEVDISSGALATVCTLALVWPRTASNSRRG